MYAGSMFAAVSLFFSSYVGWFKHVSTQVSTSTQVTQNVSSVNGNLTARKGRAVAIEKKKLSGNANVAAGVSATGTATSTKPLTALVPAPITTATTTLALQASKPALPSVPNETRFKAYITGYGWPDNTPPGAAISHGVIHASAGGVGTYNDPITLAVGHSIINNQDILDYPPGTKFYIPNLRRYFIVEDTCGDGSAPQNGPCHIGYQGNPWLDVWVGGKGVADSTVYACQSALTNIHLVVKDPAPNYAVLPGELARACTLFGDTVVTQ